MITPEKIEYEIGHLYRLYSGILVAIIDTYKVNGDSPRLGQGLVLQGNTGYPVGTSMYPLSPCEAVREEYPLTDQDKEMFIEKARA